MKPVFPNVVVPGGQPDQLHTSAPLLLAQGVHPKVMQERLGMTAVP